MIEVALLLLLLVGVGIFARSYNVWTRLALVFVIIVMLALFYLT